MKISIIIPNFNGASLLEKNIPKVCQSVSGFTAKTKNHVEVLIVDDFSADNSVMVIEKLIGKYHSENLDVILVRNLRNLGFSSAVNNGVKKATGEFVVLLNTDAFPEEGGDFFVPSLRYFDDPLCFAVGFMDKSIESDGKIVLRGRGVGTWKRGFLMHKKGDVDKKSTLWVSGGSSIFRKKVWDMLGGMNEMYNPFYWEDIDLSYRALKAGYNVFFVSECVIIHEHEKGAIKSSRSSSAIKRIVYRNQILFSWVNITDSSLFLSHFLWLPVHLAKALFRADFAMILGFGSALPKLLRVIKMRKRMGSLLKRSDSEVISTVQ